MRLASRTAERLLVGILYLMGGMASCAVFAIVMPTSWMAAVNDWLGLGPFHRSPLVEYLTRSLSALYALLGAFTLYLARNARRHLALIVVVGRLTIALGLALTAIDFAVGMPAHWSWTEGPPTVLIGWAFIFLARRAGESRPTPGA